MKRMVLQRLKSESIGTRINRNYINFWFNWQALQFRYNAPTIQMLRFYWNEIEFWYKEGGYLGEKGWIDLTMQWSPDVWKGEFKNSGQPPFGQRTLNVFSNYHHYSICISQNPGLYYLGGNFKWIQNSWSTVESMDVTARKITFF